jgi:MerR family transcriptional regulator, thiopeptide resistance regulator
MAWTIGEVARMADVTVRTLHHYDDLGLLSPAARTESGYRLYDRRDLERLQRILAYRRLGLELDKVAALLDDPDVDPVDHLRRQHDLLRHRRAELDRMITALEKTMEARKLGIQLDPEELFEVFGDDDPTRHAEEVEQRWGDTDAYHQSRRRASSYTKDDWRRMKTEAEDLGRRLVAALRAGHAADAAEAMDLAEEHRQHVSRWFYDCPPAMHRALGDMYVADPRFTKTYEDMAPGLAVWVRDAWAANAARQGA